MTQDPYGNPTPPRGGGPTPPPAPPAGDIQFDRAESAAPATGAGLAGFGPPPALGTACAVCTRPVGDYYFEAAGKVFCPDCQQAVLASEAGGSGAGRFFKALLFGFLAALAAAAAWYGVTALFKGRIFGIAAIVVAFLIGGAVKAGSGNRGGLAYQLLAVFLTYLAIGITLTAYELTHPNADADPMSPVVIAILSVLGAFISPVLAGMGSPIMGIIFLFSMWEAWQINRRQKIQFNGPYRVAPDAAAPTPPGYSPVPPGYAPAPPPPPGSWPPPTGRA